MYSAKEWDLRQEQLAGTTPAVVSLTSHIEDDKNWRISYHSGEGIGWENIKNIDEVYQSLPLEEYQTDKLAQYLKGG